MKRQALIGSLALAVLLAGIAGAAAQDAPAAAGSTAVALAPVLDLRRQASITGDAQVGQAKSAVCAACHGPQGIAIAPNFPNLAGQSATYLYVQLESFKHGQRSDPVMSGQAAALSDEDMRNLATYYAALPPKPAGAPDAASRGAALYLGGDPARGIPPCQGCHGPAGQGPQPRPSSAPQPPWASFPRLHGESALYVAKALGDFRSGARAGSSNAKVMAGVAKTLGDDDVQALAAYIAAQ
jgi:cytochrome c553